MTIRTNSTPRPSLPTSFRSLVGCACAAVFSLLLVACNPAGSEEKMRVSVSIAPLRYAVESLLDTNVVINVLTPDGASPETYPEAGGRIERKPVIRACRLPRI